MLPDVGRLVGTAEIMALFGVSKTRVRQLTDEDDWPEPFDTLKAGTFWLRDEVVAWGRRHGRVMYDEDEHTEQP